MSFSEIAIHLRSTFTPLCNTFIVSFCFFDSWGWSYALFFPTCTLFAPISMHTPLSVRLLHRAKHSASVLSMNFSYLSAFQWYNPVSYCVPKVHYVTKPYNSAIQCISDACSIWSLYEFHSEVACLRCWLRLWKAIFCIS